MGEKTKITRMTKQHLQALSRNQNPAVQGQLRLRCVQRERLAVNRTSNGEIRSKQQGSGPQAHAASKRPAGTVISKCWYMPPKYRFSTRGRGVGNAAKKRKKKRKKAKSGQASPKKTREKGRRPGLEYRESVQVCVTAQPPPLFFFSF